MYICYSNFSFPSMPSKNLQHIEVWKYPVDVDVVLLNSLYSFLFSIHMFGVFFAHF